MGMISGSGGHPSINMKDIESRTEDGVRFINENKIKDVIDKRISTKYPQGIILNHILKKDLGLEE